MKMPRLSVYRCMYSSSSASCAADSVAGARHDGREAVLGACAELDDDPRHAVLVEHALDAPGVARGQGDHVGEVLLGEHVLERGARGRGGERIAGERAADAALVDEVGVGVAEDAGGELLGDAVGADRHAAGEGLADGHDVGLQAARAGAAADAPAEGVRLVVDEQRAGLVAQRRDGLEEAGLGGTMPMLVIAGSMSTTATSRGASAARSASTSLNSTTLVVCVGSTAGPRCPAWPSACRPARRRRWSRRPCRGSTREDEHVRPLLDHAGHAQHEAVGVGRRQCELPVGQAEAVLQLGADGGGVLGRQHGGDAALAAQARVDGVEHHLRASGRSWRRCRRGRSRCRCGRPRR